MRPLSHALWLSRRLQCGYRPAPFPHPARSWLPARGFLSSRTILGRVIASDLPSEPLTLRHGRPHLRSLSPEPHRPRTLRRAAGLNARGAAGGCFLTSEGCPGAPAMKIKERTSPRSLSGLETRQPRLRPVHDGMAGTRGSILSSRPGGQKLAGGG